MIELAKQQVLRYHCELIAQMGGADGIRDENVLDSALAGPFQTFGGMELYPAVTAKIAKTVYGLVCYHPFVDGNKRTGTTVLMTLLDLNHINTDITDDEFVKIGLELANGRMSAEMLQEFIDNKTINQ